MRMYIHVLHYYFKDDSYVVRGGGGVVRSQFERKMLREASKISIPRIDLDYVNISTGIFSVR